MDAMLPVAILAGGLGTRLRPLTDALPKALVPVNGRPFIDRQLSLLASQGVRRVVLCVGHLGELIERHVDDGSSYGLAVTYSYDGPVRLGTAGALKRALPQLGPDFFCLYGDSYLLCDYAAVHRVYQAAAKSALMTLYRNENRLVRSNVLYRDGQIVTYDKEHPTNDMRHVDFGLSVLSDRSLRSLADDTLVDLAAVFQELLHDDDLAAYECASRFYEVGTADGVAELEAFLRESPGTG